MVGVLFLKPIIVIWATMNAIDDLAMLMRVARLGMMVVPGQGRNPGDMCEMCDDVMGDLLKGSEGLEALPCNWACLRVPKCVNMCEKIKAASVNSTHYPCVAAGYCDAVEEGEVDTVQECEVGPFFSCQPKKHCVRKRKGFKFSCALRPGIGRWVGMKNAVGQHAGALADGLLSQPHCGEPGASKYCIATPTGLGAVAEGIGHILSVVYGGWKTIASIESPGGDDDRQWLTFWLILTIILFIERYLARVVLSTINIFGMPVYYEMKLALLVWLLFRDGADDVYRILKKFVAKTVGGRLLRNRQRAADREELEILRRDCNSIVIEALNQERERKNAALIKRRTSLSMRRKSMMAASSSGGGAAPGAPANIIADIPILSPATSSKMALPPAPVASVDEDEDDYEEEIEGEDDELNPDEPSPRLDAVATVLLGESTPQSGTAASPTSLNKAKHSGKKAVNASLKDLLGGAADDVEDSLFIVSRYLLTSEGSEALAQINMNKSAKALLVERAAARISFQPRFVTVEVLGMAQGSFAELPAMDSNGYVDAYVTCKLRNASKPVDGAVGAQTVPYPPRGVSTSVKFRTTQPQWRQSLELTLRGGLLDPTGVFRSAESAAETELIIQVFDSDVGMWGWLLIASKLAGIVLGALCLVGWIFGYADDLSSTSIMLAVTTMAMLLGTIALSWLAYVRWGSDDEEVGEACVPLAMLMDQHTHTLHVNLRPPRDEPNKKFHEKRNSAGGLGILRVKLSMSER